MTNERRLIDANALMEYIHNRDYELVSRLGCVDKGMFTYGIEHGVNIQPTVDAMEVVRCKDCKYFFDLKCYARNFMRCDPYVPEIHMTGKNDFCSHGKKRGGASDGEN